MIISALSGLKRMALLSAVLAMAFSAQAVERELLIQSPQSVEAEQAFEVRLEASTDAVDEQVGFLQVDISTDDGATWIPMCYLQNAGSETSQTIAVAAGAAGSNVLIRARAAYRDGLAGDVDYRGAAIFWQTSWEKWETPPTKYAKIYVRAK